MTSSGRSRIDWRVDASEWEAFTDFIYDRHGTVNDDLIRQHLETAMAEYADEDRYDHVEGLVDRLVRAAGRRPADLMKKKIPAGFLDPGKRRAW